MFHNLRLMTRLNKPTYTEPAVGWTDEISHTGVTTFGVSNYEGTAKLKVKAPQERPNLLAFMAARDRNEPMEDVEEQEEQCLLTHASQ